MRWSHVCDIVYALVGSLILLTVWARLDMQIAATTGLLMVLSYFAGSVKYRHR